LPEPGSAARTLDPAGRHGSPPVTAGCRAHGAQTGFSPRLQR